MIKERKKDLIDRQDFFEELSTRVNMRDYMGSSLESRTSVTEIPSMLCAFPQSQDYEAEWVWDKEEETRYCSWCRNQALRNAKGGVVFSRFCPACGKRMKGE